MQNSVHYVRSQVNTKSLLGRPALIEMLQEQPNEKSPHDQAAEKAGGVERQQQRGFGFNNNIYNNYNPDHVVGLVTPQKRLLPNIDQQRVDMINSLKASGKIKSLGRSPVPLQLYETADAVDHLYITSVTKHVPVAHDSQLQKKSNSPESRNKNASMSNTTRLYSSSVGKGSKLANRDSIMSQKLFAQQELMQILEKGYTITDQRKVVVDARNERHRTDTDLKRSTADLVNKTDNIISRMVGEVSVTLPPGFNLKKPSRQQHRSKHTSSFARGTQDLPADNSMLRNHSTSIGGEGAIPNKLQMDSLFQDPTHDQSLFDPNAFSIQSPIVGRAPLQAMTTRNSQQFSTSQRFRSVINERTHLEISQLLQLANPSVYEEHRRRKATQHRHMSERKIMQAEPTHHNRLRDKRDTISQALVHNTWHAPVKKAQILQTVLDGADEPLDGEVDMAVVSYGIRKYGADTLDQMVEAQRTPSTKKQREARQLEMKQFEQSGQQKMAQQVSDMMNLSGGKRDQTQSRSDLEVGNSLISLKEVVRKKGSTLTDSVEIQKNQIGGSSQDFLRVSNDQIMTADATGKSGGLGKMILKQQLGMGATGVVADRPAGMTIETGEATSPFNTGVGSNKQPLPSLRQAKPESAMHVSNGKIKPDLLAKRREKRMMMHRKQSTSYIGSIHRGSQMSQTGHHGAAALSMPTGHTKSTAAIEEDAEQNLDRIIDMLAQLDDKKNKKYTSTSQQPEGEVPEFDLKKLKSLKSLKANLSSSILDIPIKGGSFVKRRKSKGGSNTKSGLQKQMTRRKKGSKNAVASEQNMIGSGIVQPESFEMLFMPTLPNEMDKNYVKPIDPVLQGKQIQSEKERQQVQDSHDYNNDIIRELLVKMAQCLQRPDSEARFLRQNVLQPHALGKYSLHQYIPKSIQLNIGQLYQPLRFRFEDFSGEFKVYFSYKNRQPSEETGYDQMASKQSQIIFPISQEHTKPNMLRYPKDKILYITMESDQDCFPSISVQHNKKDEAAIAVNSIALNWNRGNSQSMQRITSKASLSSADEDGQGSGSKLQTQQYLSDEQLESQAKITLETLGLMLGSEEKTQHAAKLNQLVKKKIQYMIHEDLDVAKDFLGLVDILRQHKARVKKIMRENMVVKSDGMQSNPALLGQNCQNELMIVEESSMAAAQSQATIVGSHLTGSDMFTNDYYRLLKEGRITKQQYNEKRREEQKQKKQEIDAVKHVRSLEQTTKKEYRKQLQDHIVNNLRKQAAERRFVSIWCQNIIVYKLASKLTKALVKSKKDAEFMSKVFWLVLKAKMNLSIKLKRWGRKPEERLRRQMRMAICTLGSSIHLREMTAGKTVVEAFKWMQTLTTLKQCVKDTSHHIRFIQERFRAYWQVRMAQIDMIIALIDRERERLFVASIKETDKDLKTVGSLASKISPENIRKVATAYYQACQFTYEPIFFAWRNKIAEFRALGLEDMTSGWHNPFLMSRGIKSMAEVGYAVNYKRVSLQRFLERASKTCRSRFQYFMNVDEGIQKVKAAASGTATEDNVSESTAQRMVGKISSTMNARSKSKLRRKNPHFATLQDAIAQQEEKFQAEIITDLKNAAYYPPRPAMKFIPTARMTHQLIHQAMMLNNMKIEAPNSWRDKYDAASRIGTSSQGSFKIPRTASTNKSKEPFQVIAVHARLRSNAPIILESNVSVGRPIGATPEMQYGEEDPLHNQTLRSEVGIKMGGVNVGDQFVQPSRILSAHSSRMAEENPADEESGSQGEKVDQPEAIIIGDSLGTNQQTPELLATDDESLVDRTYMRSNTYATVDDPPGDMDGMESGIDKNVDVRVSMPSSSLPPLNQEAAEVEEVDNV